VFSLGVVLYELLAGRRPFGGATELEVLQTVIHGAPAPLPEEVPAELRAIVQKALEKNPAERYQSVGDLAVDLRRMARPATVAVSSTTTASPGSRSSAWIAAAALVLLAAGAAVWLATRTSPPPPAVSASEIRSIAVLPLDNLSGDPAQEYLSDGTTEELIAALAQVHEIRVISRTSVMRYKGAKKGIPEIGRELGVDGIIEGSVRRAEGRVRVTAQLIHAASDTHVWANNFDEDAADILKLQTDVARAIVQEIRVALTPDETSRLAAAKRVHPMAWDETLVGHSLRWKGEQEDLRQAILHYERALELQPDYAPAVAGLAMAWVNRAVPDAHSRARAAAIKAVELDPNLAEAHAAMAWTSEWNWEEGEREARLALAINPNSLDRCGCFVVQLSSMGRFAEAVSLSDRMVTTNPAVAFSHRQYGAVLYHARRFDEAIARLQKALNLDADENVARLLLSQVYEATGKVQEALDVLDRPAFKDSGPLGLAHAVAGHRDEALRIARAVAQSEGPTSWRRALAMIYFALGDKDRGFEWLGRSLDAHEGLAQMMIEVPFDSVRSDPRFLAQLTRLGFPPDAVAAVTAVTNAR
jgi:TolB-like protein